jgi:hypothetical protein
MLWFLGLGALPAIIFGTISRRKASHAHRKPSYMSTVGLVLGWIGLAGGVFCWLLFAGLATART